MKRHPQPRVSGVRTVIALLSALILQAGCTGVPYSTQSLAIGSLVDPALEPLRGCEALSGEWRNRGERLSEYPGNAEKDAVFTGAIDMTAQAPEAAFADRVRIETQDDGSLALLALDGTLSVGSLRFAPGMVQCAPDAALLHEPARARLSVDARGALWLKTTGGLASIPLGYRFLPIDDQRPVCSTTPDGLASVIVGIGDHQAIIEHTDNVLPSMMMQDGKASHAQSLYLLPDEHEFSLLVWTPGVFWTDRPQTTLSVRARLQACHTYVPVGWHRAGSDSWATLVDLGPGFNSRQCVSTVSYKRYDIRFSPDERVLLVSAYCFEDRDPAVREPPPREFPLPQSPSAT